MCQILALSNFLSESIMNWDGVSYNQDRAWICMTVDYSEQYERLLRRFASELNSFVKHEWGLEDSKQKLSDIIASFMVKSAMLYKKRRGLA